MESHYSSIMLIFFIDCTNFLTLISVSVMFENVIYYSVCVYRVPRLFLVRITECNMILFLKFLQKAAVYG